MKKEKKEETIKKIIKSKPIQIFLCLIIALFIYGVIVLINNYKEYVKINLSSNNNSIFSLSDFNVSNLSYGDLQETAITMFGKPKKIIDFKDNKTKYRTYYYDGLELTFKNQNESYIFMKAIVTKEGYLVSRNIKIGDKISDVMNKFFVEDTNSEYMYGNYKEKDIDGKTVKDNVFFGRRQKNLVYYIYMSSPYKNGYASLKDDIVQLTLKYKFGKVNRIEMMYGPLE